MPHIFTCKFLSPALLLIAMVAFCGAAFAATTDKASPADFPLYPLYQQISIDFWNAENRLQARVDPFANEHSPYKSPLAKTDLLYQKYFQVDQSAGKYVAALDQQKKTKLDIAAGVIFRRNSGFHHW